MNNDVLKYAQQLEFDKICALIAQNCISAGARQSALLLRPYESVAQSVEALSDAEALRTLIISNSTPRISPVDGVVEIAGRAQKGGILSMGELLYIKSLLANARALRSWFSQKDDREMPVERYFYMLYEDSGLERDINDCILSESEMSDDASGELASIRKRIVRAENSIRDKLDSIIKSSETAKYLQDAVITIRGGRFVVPVKTEHRNAIQGLIHDVSGSGSTQFIEPAAVVEANNVIMQLKAEEMREIDRILAAFTNRVAAVGDLLKTSYESYIQLDLLLAIAKYAVVNDAVKPQLNDRGYINIKKGRHPLIPSKNVVPVDVSLGADYTMLVITGPNTGGKTVTLKTVGLFTLMAMSGILVPAGLGTELAYFDRVLVDIGDEQSIQQNLSTFSSHMKNISEILTQADDTSLVLLDELGAGTDPAEGAALAVAILERLRGYDSRTIATTHYGEIKLYAMKTQNVQNASCEFDVKTLKPTYRVTIGLPGRSNALLIGERLGLDKALLDQARKNMSSDNLFFEDALGEIEELKNEITYKEQIAEQKVLEAEKTLQKAEQKYAELVKQGENELENTRRKAKQLSADVSANAYKLLDEIKKLNAEKDKGNEAARRAREIANHESQRIYDMAPEQESVIQKLEPAEDFSVGALVFVPSINQTAEILTPPDASGNVELKAGLIKSRVHKDALKNPPQNAVKTQKKQNKKIVSTVCTGESRSGQNEVNLIGLTVEEAIMVTDQFIDNAVLSHLNTVYLIHGKGTGALRAGVQSHLKKLRSVKSFRLGGFGEGEDGVTIVELK